ncbi:MAG: hypothetical protein KAT35_01570, partial [Candidatus Aenigmarchaeota archaeon]|nr:hypothetical protein [Candidatus Aenigmarchaeota archaeon]
SNSTLELQVNDSDKNELLYSGDARFFVTTNEDTTSTAVENYTWVLDTTDGITGPGYVEDTFTSSPCSYLPGPQKWKVEFEYLAHSGFYITNSTLYDINITVDPLQAAVELPPTNQTRRKGIDDIPIRGNVTTTDCSSQLVPNATVILEVQGKDYQCTPITNETTGGWYNCTIPFSDPVSLGWGYGYYNITMNASKLHYNSTLFTVKEDAFRLVSEPLLTNVDVTSTATGTPGPVDDWGWGELWHFDMHVEDPDQDTFGYEELNVTVYVNTSTGWRQLNSTATTSAGNGQDIELTFHNFSCSDQGSREFMFNITDIFSYVNSSSVVRTIQKDTVFIQRSLPADDTPVDREGGSQLLFEIWIKDTDNNTAVPSGYNTSFWFTQDGTINTYDSGWNSTTDASGYSQLNFNPNCSYEAGLQYWKSGVYEDECYVSQNFSAPDFYQFYVIGQLKHELLTPNWSSGQPSYNVTDPVQIRYNVTSECSNWPDENPVTSAATNVTLQAPNGTWEGKNDPSESSGTYNYTWDSTGKNEGNWSIMINSSRTNFNFNSTVYDDWFWLENIEPQNQTDPQVSPTSDGWTRLFNYTINLTDAENDTTNCTLWISTDDQATWSNNGTFTLPNGNGICYVTVEDFNQSDVNFSSGYDTDNYFYFTIADIEENNTYNTSIIPGPVLEPSNITIDEILGNESAVNITSDGSEYTPFILRINDTDNQSAPVPMNMTFWVQLNSTHWDWGNTTLTNQTGFANYNFAPNCSYEPGER